MRTILLGTKPKTDKQNYAYMSQPTWQTFSSFDDNKILVPNFIENFIFYPIKYCWKNIEYQIKDHSKRTNLYSAYCLKFPPWFPYGQCKMIQTSSQNWLATNSSPHIYLVYRCLYTIYLQYIYLFILPKLCIFLSIPK